MIAMFQSNVVATIGLWPGECDGGGVGGGGGGGDSHVGGGHWRTVAAAWAAAARSFENGPTVPPCEKAIDIRRHRVRDRCDQWDRPSPLWRL